MEETKQIQTNEEESTKLNYRFPEWKTLPEWKMSWDNSWNNAWDNSMPTITNSSKVASAGAVDQSESKKRILAALKFYSGLNVLKGLSVEH